eukprot:gnl/MRDRNA2_/MRDRNA2_80147_c0_seq2.p1 gnl/MRDRNA2_/MRDRNA2_80147_c0~~gnl/MRDRNA2_/MRDRNA2_80147_c0_seq2.p1  ORF type:complete len:245 (+),score=21.75 gnl/MRDRNA2_/MRDRNA2_80147_c0_seq2:236-970(+)
MDGTTLAKSCRGFVRGSPLLAPSSKFQICNTKVAPSGPHIRSLASQFSVPASGSLLPSHLKLRSPSCINLCFLTTVPRFSAAHADPPTVSDASNQEFWQQAFQALINNEEKLLNTMASEGYLEVGRGALWVEYGEDYQIQGDNSPSVGFQNLAAVDAIQRNDFLQRTINLGEGAMLKLRYLPYKTWYASEMGQVTESLNDQIEGYNPQTSFLVVLQAFGVTGGSQRRFPEDFLKKQLVNRRGMK